jgi:hypothetical protein
MRFETLRIHDPRVRPPVHPTRLGRVLTVVYGLAVRAGLKCNLNNDLETDPNQAAWTFTYGTVYAAVEWEKFLHLALLLCNNLT